MQKEIKLSYTQSIVLPRRYISPLLVNKETTFLHSSLLDLEIERYKTGLKLPQRNSPFFSREKNYLGEI